MNDRYRNCIKALDHIRKCRKKEKLTVLIPFIGYVYLPSGKLAKAILRRSLYPMKKVKHWEVKDESPILPIEPKVPLDIHPIDTGGYTIYIDGQPMN